MNLLQLIKKIKSHALLKNSSIVFVGSMLANFSAYLFHLFVGRILGPVEYGVLTAIMSLFFIFNVPSIVVQTVFVRYFSILRARGAHGQVKRLFTKITRLTIIASIVGIVFVIPVLPGLRAFLHIDSNIVFIWLYIILATQMLVIINTSLLQAYQKFFMSMIYTNIVMGTRLILGIVFSYIGVVWTLFGNVLSNIIGYFTYFFSIKFLGEYKSEPLSITKKHMASYSFPALFATLGVTALYSQDVIWVKHFFSAEEAGLYSSLSVLGKIIFFASAALVFVAFPMIAERKEKKQKYTSVVLLSLGAVALISFSLTTIYFLFPNFVVAFLYGSAYENAAGYLGIFGLFISGVSLSNMLVQILLSLGDKPVWIFSMGAAFAQAVLLNQNHASLRDMIQINGFIGNILFVVLFFYYLYAYQKKKT